MRYGEQFGNDGLWEGSLYIFDGRMTQDFGDNTAVIGTCESCGLPTNTLQNCSDLACRELSLLCESCHNAECFHAGSARR